MTLVHHQVTTLTPMMGRLGKICRDNNHLELYDEVCELVAVQIGEDCSQNEREEGRAHQV